MSTLLIARHGNTFDPGDNPTRVGARTDLPLVEKGRAQAKALGAYLKTQGYQPDAVYCSELARTRETAQIVLAEMGCPLEPQPHDIFNEIDYGPDENQPENVVKARLGEKALSNWDKSALMPPDWGPKPKEIVQNWLNFATEIGQGQTILVVTSNGIARFAPHITGDFDSLATTHPIKLSTGALGILQHTADKWQIQDWNIHPALL